MTKRDLTKMDQYEMNKILIPRRGSPKSHSHGARKGHLCLPSSELFIKDDSKETEIPSEYSLGDGGGIRLRVLLPY